ncbi:retrovirus-related pol polyprotein from transposon TNT 1-94 [Tanacetum coccineum]|uniref:Retrovirus-related pol polyprotein from transposon TNT 1-94 n=1 Tax=Tanacetum coccineum TaxID=301880 RepID=A0ABQ5C415_9ASTR
MIFSLPMFYGEEIEELSENICLMAIIQPVNIDGSSNDSAFLSEVVQIVLWIVDSGCSKHMDLKYFMKQMLLAKQDKAGVILIDEQNDFLFAYIILWIVDSGCSTHMTGDRSLLKNFVEKFIRSVRYGNNHFATIRGYGHYVQGNITICHVYYVEVLGYFCDGDCESNLYTISTPDMVASSPICLMSKASSTKSWLWHRRLSHLDFGTINYHTKHDPINGLLKFKYGKDHLYSACELGKSKKASHPPKMVPSSHSNLELLHMDLCGPMSVPLINGKKYILMIIDDYSRFTWVYFLHSKDETLEIIKKSIAQVQLNYDAKIH